MVQKLTRLATAPNTHGKTEATPGDEGGKVGEILHGWRTRHRDVRGAESELSHAA